MLRISKLADYGLVLLSRFVAAEPGDADGDRGNNGRAPRRPLSATELAEQSRLPLPTVSKVLKILTQAQLLVSRRGAKGGYELARPSVSISVFDVIVALDGPIAVTDCSSADPDSCGRREGCPTSVNWRRINLALETALKSVSVREMVAAGSDAIPSAGDLRETLTDAEPGGN
jgi:FeS assembly SUF system regulator